MRLIILTRISDGAKMYINPEQICAIYPYYKKGGATCVQFAGADNFIEVKESPDSIANIINDMI